MKRRYLRRGIKLFFYITVIGLVVPASLFASESAIIYGVSKRNAKNKDGDKVIEFKVSGRQTVNKHMAEAILFVEVTDRKGVVYYGVGRSNGSSLADDEPKLRKNVWRFHVDTFELDAPRITAYHVMLVGRFSEEILDEKSFGVKELKELRARNRRSENLYVTQVRSRGAADSFR